MGPDEALDIPAALARRFPGRDVSVVRRNIDARGRDVRVELVVEPGDPVGEVMQLGPPYREPGSRRAVVVGAGPAGLFAAHSLLVGGVTPVVIERGSAFPRRHFEARSLRLWGKYQSAAFTSGLGGAGTYSDGKLYTRKRTPGVREVLRLLAHFGSDRDIMVETHAHVGSNRLPVIIERMVASLQGAGAQFRFNETVSGLKVRGGRVVGVVLEGGEEVFGDAVVLAVGNSARETFASLHDIGVAMRAKPFAVGLRMEHPRPLIDRLRLGRWAGHEALGAARYSFAYSREGRGIFSFCMCPGGHLLPTPPEAGLLAVNGMSHSLRGSEFSNAAVVVSVQPEELTGWGSEPFQGVGFQRHLEEATFQAGGGGYCAPAQRMVDFLSGRASATLPASSYRPGLVPARLDLLLPGWLVDELRWGLAEAGEAMRGFVSEEALLVGSETLTSSPVQFLRGESGQSVSHQGLFPVGEGAGWGGGITTSAADGLEVGSKLARLLAGRW